MNNLFKVLGVLFVLFMITGCGQQVEVVEENGYMVLDVEQEEGFQTIVAKIIDLEEGNLDYGAMAVNLFDPHDMVTLEREQIEGLKSGDIVLVTFEGISISKVEINNLNIGEHIRGQRVSDSLIDELSNGGYFN